ERIGTEMFASFWHHSRHRNPQHDVIHERHHSHESRIVAFMFTKSQLEGWRDYWDLLTSGNCWCDSIAEVTRHPTLGHRMGSCVYPIPPRRILMSCHPRVLEWTKIIQ